MSIKDSLQTGFNQLISRAGKPIGITYYSLTVGSVWDDEVVLAKSGNTLWTSGIVLPVGQADSVLVEQGKLSDSDQRLYVNGSLSFVGSEMQVEIQLGSTTTTDQIFTKIPGGTNPEVEDQRMYRKIYIRRLTTGSLSFR